MRIPTQKVPNADVGTLVASRIVSTGACKLLAVIVLNTNGSQQYIQVHESATVPAEGQVPDLPSIPVAGGTVAMFDFGPGVDLDNCTICNSSTSATKTIGAADCQILALIAA